MAGTIPSIPSLSKTKPVKAPETDDVCLSDLNKDYARMVDTYIYDYPRLVRDTKEPFAKVTDANVKVAIVGAGFAGATAAFELRRAGMKNITIYEARGQIGGRADSRPFTDDQQRQYINEMGAMRVPENAKLFWHYLSSIGVRDDELQPIFPNPGIVATEIIYRGIRYTWKDEDFPQPTDPGNPNNVDWERLFNDLLGDNGFFASLTDPHGTSLGDVVDLLKQENLSDFEKRAINNYWSHFLQQYDDVTFVGALEAFFNSDKAPRQWGAKEYNMFSTLGLGTGGFGPLFPVCFLDIFRILLWDYANEYRPSLPIQEIVKKLLKYNPETKEEDDEIEILYETVDYIGMDTKRRSLPYKVNIHSIVNDEEQDKNDIKVRQYDYVIVAAPLRSMQIRMNLDAAVSPERYADKSSPVFAGTGLNMVRESLPMPHIVDSSKLFGFLPKRPWDIDKNWPHHTDKNGKRHPVKCVLTDTLARQMYFLDPYENEKNAGSNVLISYSWGDDATKIAGIQNYNQLQAIDPRANPDFVLKQAYEFGLETAIKDNPVATALKQISVEDQDKHLTSVIWQNEPMIFGAFKLDFPNQYYYTSQMVYQYQDANKTIEPPSPFPPISLSRGVYLAGNNCSYHGGWIEGAMQSGVNACCAVLKTMSLRNQATDFERMEVLFAPNPFQNVLSSISNKYQLSPLESDLAADAEFEKELAAAQSSNL